MEIWSFAEIGSHMVPVQVEVGLMRGLADIQVMGLPDQALKESLLRVKAAIKNQGFNMPKAHKVLVNLKPTNQRKSGRGLELAIAMAVLIETGQIQAPDEAKTFAYGQLGLKGEVNFLDEVNWLPMPHKERVWSGRPESAVDRNLKVINELAELNESCTWIEASEPEELERPGLTQFSFSKKLSELLKIVAHGGHHIMMSGPAGSGKSTAAYALHSLLPSPSVEETREIKKWNRYFNKDSSSWRPMQAPHHTATAQAMLGGGNPPEPGEITRAHNGVLLLDEFLEFPVRIREGLREPIERAEVQISRRGFSEKLPAKFQLVATSNLCPCGDFVPKQHQPACRFSKTKCQSYLERLSGPLADRFDILSFSYDWNGEMTESGAQVFKQVQNAQEFLHKRGQLVPNARLQWRELILHLEKPSHLSFLPEAGRSKRRHISILRVARSIADIDSSRMININHIRQALDYSWRPFEALRDSFL